MHQKMYVRYHIRSACAGCVHISILYICTLHHFPTPHISFRSYEVFGCQITFKQTMHHSLELLGRMELCIASPCIILERIS